MEWLEVLSLVSSIIVGWGAASGGHAEEPGRFNPPKERDLLYLIEKAHTHSAKKQKNTIVRNSMCMILIIGCAVCICLSIYA